MPNWCSNYVELTHDNPDMLRRAEDAFNRGELLAEFIPVPASLQIVAGRVGDDNDVNQKALDLKCINMDSKIIEKTIIQRNKRFI